MPAVMLESRAVLVLAVLLALEDSSILTVTMSPARRALVSWKSPFIPEPAA